MLKDDLPDIYADILDDTFLSLNPKETLATCGDCFKAKKTSPSPHYNPKLKCCTYYPFIPNYLVGALLSEELGEWTAAINIIKKLIRDRRYTLPIGLCAPPGYQNLFREKTLHDFGNREDLLCPFYKIQTGGCSIWKFRGHECATFFCVSSYGQKGEEFWQGTREYLFNIEMELSQDCMMNKGYTPQETEENLNYIKRTDSDQNTSFAMTAVEWSKTWVHHQDNIEEYYKACFKFVINNKSGIKKSLNERLSSTKNDRRLCQSLFVGRSL